MSTRSGGRGQSIGWWIADGPLDGTGGRARGERILGPFVSQDGVSTLMALDGER